MEVNRRRAQLLEKAAHRQHRRTLRELLRGGPVEMLRVLLVGSEHVMQVQRVEDDPTRALLRRPYPRKA